MNQPDGLTEEESRFLVTTTQQCNTVPQTKDSTRFQWHDVRKIDHYYLSVNAITKPMEIKEDKKAFGDNQ
ncbi:MAG: hypothetical protein V1789_12830 [PVC group bacterium]